MQVIAYITCVYAISRKIYQVYAVYEYTMSETTIGVSRTTRDLIDDTIVALANKNVRTPEQYILFLMKRDEAQVIVIKEQREEINKLREAVEILTRERDDARANIWAKDDDRADLKTEIELIKSKGIKKTVTKGQRAMINLPDEYRGKNVIVTVIE